MAAPSYSPTATPADGADVLKNGMYYHSGRPITEGWNGLRWTAGLEEMKAMFPGARPVKEESNSYLIGQGEEKFFGFTLPAVYHFDERGRFIAVSFTCQDQRQAQMLVTSLISILGVPQDKRLMWQFGPAIVRPLHYSVVIRGVPPEF
ncbi:MAG: hypothetical protein V1742_00530 [Pseudomonadota bacterium]